MSQIYELLQQCTVKITLPTQSEWGTGFFVAPGLILTCAHVVKGLNPGASAQISWQQEGFAEATIVECPPKLDLALLQFSTPQNANLPCVYLDREFQPTDNFYTYGYPDSFPDGASVTSQCEGDAHENGVPLILFKAGLIRPGFSGSPLLNLRTGTVCGIVKFTRDRSIDLGGGAIPTKFILEQFPALREQQRSFHQSDQRWRRQIQALSDSIPANLPRSGVVEFVGRAEAMTQLHEMLQQGDQVAVTAVVGMGGIGKTELALRYALKYKQTYAGGLCWLQARSGNVGTQLVNFGRRFFNLNPPDGMELADQVQYCWRNWQTGEVLLVFDDVTKYRAIEDYLPPATEPRFKVLMTTRLQLWKPINQLPLDTLDEEAALALLESLVGSARLQSQLDGAKRWCEQLGYLPLALELSGRYLACEEDLSVAKLLKQLEGQQLTARALCQTEEIMTAKLGVAAAFQLSWKALSTHTQLLGYGLSLFAAASIPWSLVEQCFSKQDSEELEGWRRELLNLHLLQRVADSTYRLHPLIRDFLRRKRDELATASEQEYNFCQVMVGVAEEIPDSLTPEIISSVKDATILHLAEVAQNLTGAIRKESLLPFFIKLGKFYKRQGLFAMAEPLYKHCVSVVKYRLREEHPDIAISLNNLANIYCSEGRYNEAEQQYKQALELDKRMQREKDPNYANSLSGLANVYYSQGRYEEAEQRYKQALKLDERMQREKHPDYATSLSGLANLYYSQRRYEEAEQRYKQALKLDERMQREEHPDYATSLSGLANLYCSQGHYEEAEQSYKQALKLRKKMLGEKHPDVATSMNNLANLYYSQGRYEEAEQSYEQALELRKEMLGEKHPDYATSLSGLANLYRSQGRRKEAIPLCEQALEIRTKVLGEEHHNTVIVRETLELLRDEISKS